MDSNVEKSVCVQASLISGTSSLAECVQGAKYIQVIILVY
jgi:hypothetical protein